MKAFWGMTVWRSVVKVGIILKLQASTRTSYFGDCEENWRKYIK
ncbi:hypothetical protein N577_000680 [Lacticaseibacillus rhamnosus 2166]|nr:hypothetical protein N577_000680 [Lacticaseibacillus rhamnosus 2166]